MIAARSVFEEMEKMPTLTPKQQRQIAIGKTILNTAFQIMHESAKLRKKARFYNRHPLTKYARALVQFRIGSILRSGHMQLNMILTQPIPKYPSGGIIGREGAEIVMERSNERFHLVDEKQFRNLLPLPQGTTVKPLHR